MATHSVRVAVLSVIAAAACGPKAEGDTDDGTGTTTAATSTATEPTATEPTATGPTTTAGQVCEGFLDQQIAGPEVTVEIANQSDAVVFVLPGPACSSDPLLELRQDGAPLRFRESVCDFTCADHFAGQCFCAADCALAPAIRLEPGGVHRTTWAGEVFVPVTPPAACFPEDCGDTCEQRQAAGAGAYTFASAAGRTAASCEDAPEPCMCTPNADGWCELFALEATAIGDVVALEAAFTYPDDTLVTLVIE